MESVWFMESKLFEWNLQVLWKLQCLYWITQAFMESQCFVWTCNVFINSAWFKWTQIYVNNIIRIVVVSIWFHGLDIISYNQHDFRGIGMILIESLWFSWHRTFFIKSKRFSWSWHYFNVIFIEIWKISMESIWFLIESIWFLLSVHDFLQNILHCFLLNLHDFWNHHYFNGMRRIFMKSVRFKLNPLWFTWNDKHLHGIASLFLKSVGFQLNQ